MLEAKYFLVSVLLAILSWHPHLSDCILFQECSQLQISSLRRFIKFVPVFRHLVRVQHSAIFLRGCRTPVHGITIPKYGSLCKSLRSMVMPEIGFEASLPWMHELL